MTKHPINRAIDGAGIAQTILKINKPEYPRSKKRIDRVIALLDKVLDELGQIKRDETHPPPLSHELSPLPIHQHEKMGIFPIG